MALAKLLETEDAHTLFLVLFTLFVQFVPQFVLAALGETEAEEEGGVVAPTNFQTAQPVHIQSAPPQTTLLMLTMHCQVELPRL